MRRRPFRPFSGPRPGSKGAPGAGFILAKYRLDLLRLSLVYEPKTFSGKQENLKNLKNVAQKAEELGKPDIWSKKHETFSKLGPEGAKTRNILLNWQILWASREPKIQENIVLLNYIYF